jgi:hypothetical protein
MGNFLIPEKTFPEYVGMHVEIVKVHLRERFPKYHFDIHSDNDEIDYTPMENRITIYIDDHGFVISPPRLDEIAL